MTGLSCVCFRGGWPPFFRIPRSFIAHCSGWHTKRTSTRTFCRACAPRDAGVLVAHRASDASSQFDLRACAAGCGHLDCLVPVSGPRNTLHHSIRYYKTVHPRFYEAAESFAVLLRDPLEPLRLVLCLRAPRAATKKAAVSANLFRAETGAYPKSRRLSRLPGIAGDAMMAMDFVMRPQSWFVSDLRTGVPLVKKTVSCWARTRNGSPIFSAVTG